MTYDPTYSEPRLPGSVENEEDELIAGGKVMSVWDHLSELRSRVVRSLISIFAVFCVCMAFSDELLNFMKQPLLAALPPGSSGLHFTNPLDVFVVQIKVSLLAGAVFSAPLWLFQFWKFFEPALYPRERRYVLPFIVISTALFYAGTLFCFFVILPLTLDVLIKLGMEVGTPLITVKDYVSLLLMLVLGFGAVFEFPVLITLLALLNVVSVDNLVKYRKFVVLAILIVAALVTPPDPISQVALSIPVYLMYELAIVVVRWVKKAETKKMNASPTKV